MNISVWTVGKNKNKGFFTTKQQKIIFTYSHLNSWKSENMVYTS